MDNYYNPAPIDREIKVNPSFVLMFKINKDEIIEYINHAFSEVSGYEEFEIIGEKLDLLKHPEMPKVIYQMLKERFEKKEPIRLISKALAKDGRFFWLISDFETKVDDSGEILAHYCHSFAAPSFAVNKVDALYKILLNIELKTGNLETSRNYLIGFLEERNLTYNQFIEELSINRPEFDDSFVQQSMPMTRPQAIVRPQEVNHHIAKPAQQVQSIQPKPKKQKSFLKKVFGK